MSQRYAPETEQTILRLIKKGTFTSEADVIDRAVHVLDEELRLEEFRQSIEEGFAEIERGEGIVLTKETWDQLVNEAREANRLGLPMDDDE